MNTRFGRELDNLRFFDELPSAVLDERVPEGAAAVERTSFPVAS